MAYFIGIDIGTTSTKSIVFTRSGVIKGIASRGYPLLSPKPGWLEQDPDAIFSAVIEATQQAIQQAAPHDIAAVGVSGAMHSLIVMDQHHFPITHSITWGDTRSSDQAEQLKQNGIGLYQRTGTPIHPMSPLTKLVWMRQQDPDTFQRAAKFISIKEYVFYRLFERYVVDYSIASATGLFNLNELNWDDEALSVAGIRPDQLSELVPTTYRLRGMKTRYAEMMGLHADTPVVIGASDGVLANLGVGAIAPDQVAVTIGTSGAVRKVIAAPATDPQGRTFCYALTEQHWVIGGPSNNGGMILRWFRDQFGLPEVEQAKLQGVDPYDILIQRAATVPAGAEGLILLPFLSGERAPYWNPDAKGVFFGVSIRHERAHFIRAVLEGILFSVYSITTVLSELTGDDSKVIRASGGFARSKFWRQMMADLFGYEVLAPEVYEASGFGAAVLAMYSIGAISDLTEVQPLIQIRDRHQPNPELSDRYHQLFEIYQRVYHNLVEEFTALAQFQRQQP